MNENATGNAMPRKTESKTVIADLDCFGTLAGMDTSFLDPHQKEGVHWILSRRASYLAHAPGAGKTCQAITAACFICETLGQVVFIVPPGLTLNWAREIELWTDKLRRNSYWPSVSIVGRSSRQETVGWKAEFLIIPDSMLTKPWVLDRLVAIKKRLIAVDEASRFKEATAERTVALFGGRFKNGKTTPGAVAASRHVVLMDGSPMPNRPMELWAPTYAIAPEAIDHRDQLDFGYRYCGATINDRGHWEFKHSNNEEELKKKLQRRFMHVVGESALKHPERRRSILFMDKDARSATHRTWERENLHAIKLDGGEEASQGELARFRAELGMRKVPWIADYVADRLKTKNESILLFAWHRDVCLELSKRLVKFPHGLVMGGTPNEKREDFFKAFQAGDIKLLIANIAAMGRGHNLQRADRVVFGEFSWTNETNLQAEKRASRKGSTKAFVRCDYICSPNSIDEKVLKTVFTKEKRVKRVIG